ncbi:MAG: hypothetical protein AAFQ79_17535 [Pseudomonadota bacterium]
MRALLALLALTLPAHTEPITLVPYTDLEPRLTTRVDFEDFPRRLSPGISLDGIQPVEGAALGERFQGQLIWQQDGFDRTGLIPDAPLALVAGAEGQNLSIALIYQLSNQLQGLAPPGYPATNAEGEGSVAVLFDRDQFALGFRVAAEPRPRDGNGTPGQMTVQFFARDARLIAEKTVTLGWGRQAYGFVREGEATDIAGITITNADPAGIAIDDLIFDTDLAIGWGKTTDNSAAASLFR